MYILEDSEQCKIILKALWEQSLTGVAIVDEHGKFLYVNQTFCRLLHYTEYELQTKTFQDITVAEDVTADTQMKRAILEGDIENYDMNKTYITKTRQFLPVLLRVTGIRTSGKFIYFVKQIAAESINQREEPQKDTQLKSRRFAIGKTIKEYWLQIAAIGTIIIAVLDRFIAYALKE